MYIDTSIVRPNYCKFHNSSSSRRRKGSAWCSAVQCSAVQIPIELESATLHEYTRSHKYDRVIIQTNKQKPKTHLKQKKQCNKHLLTPLITPLLIYICIPIKSIPDWFCTYYKHIGIITTYLILSTSNNILSFKVQSEN